MLIAAASHCEGKNSKKRLVIGTFTIVNVLEKISKPTNAQSTELSCEALTCPPLPPLDPKSGHYECNNSTNIKSSCK